MEMLFSKQNPKALQLDGLDSISKKVTIGFKCNPRIKLRLAKVANEFGLTLSEYIEALLLDLDNAPKKEANEISELKNKLAFYENDFLKNLFKQYEGKETIFKNPDGDDLKIKVVEAKDIYTIIINSFKIKK